MILEIPKPDFFKGYPSTTRTHRCMNDHPKAQTKPGPASVLEDKILKLLKGGFLLTGEIADKLGSDRPQISSRLCRMRDKRLIESKPIVKHGRWTNKWSICA